MKIKLSTIMIILTVAIISACGKYEEGPGLSLRSKKARVANIWIVEKATDLVDNIDITADYTGDSFEFTKDGDYLENGTKQGTWDFNSDKTFLVVSLNDASTDEFKIIELREKSMQLEIVGEEMIFLAPK